LTLEEIGIYEYVEVKLFGVGEGVEDGKRRISDARAEPRGSWLVLNCEPAVARGITGSCFPFRNGAHSDLVSHYEQWAKFIRTSGINLE
jgi:hypothetical protein